MGIVSSLYKIARIANDVSALASGNPKPKSSLPIADCRLTIEKVVWQLLPMSISNRQSKIGNSSHPGPSDDRGKSSRQEKKLTANATAPPLAATKSRFFAPLRMTCHPDPALPEKDLLFFAPRDEVGP